MKDTSKQTQAAPSVPKIQLLKAFWRGLREFKQNVTTSYGGKSAIAYDHGREWAHKLTFRHFEQ